MKLEELARILRELDPAAVLVDPPALARVAQEVTGSTWAVWRVPHSRCLAAPWAVLAKHAERGDIAPPPDHRVGDPVLLLERPTADQLAGRQPDILGRYWKLLFHAAADRAVGRRVADLTPADLRDRIERVGPAAFEEARNVLVHDGLLPAHADDRAAWAEFVVYHAELRQFNPALIPVCFPSLPDGAAAVLAADLDAPALFAKTRPPHAPDPAPKTDDQSDESHDYYNSLTKTAAKAGRHGDTVQAAILHTKAARVAPGSKTAVAQTEARKDLDRLVGRLQEALALTPAEAAAWRRLLPALLDKADQGNRPVEAAILYDLQRACIEHEQPVYAVALADYALSWGRRPIRRELVGRRFVRVPEQLRTAYRRLTTARLTDADRQALAGLLRAAEAGAERRLRETFRPVLAAAFAEAGIRPAALAEEAALTKTVEELLDRISAAGFLGYPEVRDAIARGQMKLPDLDGRREFVWGDPLARLDRLLAARMDGVYRRGEVYTRALGRLSAAAFGTAPGRWLTRTVVVPFGGAFLLFELVWVLVHQLWEWGLVGRGEAPDVLEGGWNAEGGFHAGWVAFGAFLLAMTRSAGLRRAVGEVGRGAYRAARLVFWELPARVWANPWVRRVVASVPAQVVLNLLLKPAGLTAAVMVGLRRGGAGEVWGSWAVWGLAFVTAALTVNSPVGRTAEAAVLAAGRGLADLLRSLPALLRWVSDVFRELVYVVGWVLNRVDDGLRLRGKGGPAAVAVRAAGGLLWAPVGFLVRLYTVVLIEPAINPLKLPLSILFAKFVYPLLLMSPGLFEKAPDTLLKYRSPLVADLAGYLTLPGAWLLIMGTCYLLPDAVTYLFWEMRENWRLYRANRPPGLRPAAVGSHGETVGGLLHWGIHSGTVPKLYARLRAAERDAARTDNWRDARVYWQSLREVEEAVRRFVVRDFVGVLNDPAAAWGGPPLAVGRVQLGTNRIRVELVPQELRNADFGVRNPEPGTQNGPPAGSPSSIVNLKSAILEWEDRAGWLVARWADPGFVADLPAGPARVLADALAYLYRRAGVDVVREQVAAGLPAGAAHFDVGWDGLLVWYGRLDEPPVAYDLGDPVAELRPRTPGRGRPAAGPTLDADRLIFARAPLTWAGWTSVWEPGLNGDRPRFGPPDGDQTLLPPRPPAAEPAAVVEPATA